MSITRELVRNTSSQAPPLLNQNLSVWTQKSVFQQGFQVILMPAKVRRSAHFRPALIFNEPYFFYPKELFTSQVMLYP